VKQAIVKSPKRYGSKSLAGLLIYPQCSRDNAVLSAALRFTWIYSVSPIECRHGVLK